MKTYINNLISTIETVEIFLKMDVIVRKPKETFELSSSSFVYEDIQMRDEILHANIIKVIIQKQIQSIQKSSNQMLMFMENQLLKWRL